MPLESLRRRHVGKRFIAGVAIGLMTLGAFAAPAAAEDPDSVDTMAQSGRYDYNGDGNNDMVYVRRNGGKLYLRAGDGSGNYGSPQQLLTGFTKMDVVMAGDLTGDGFADLVARDNQSGRLFTYPGDGEGGFGTRILVGTKFSAMGVLTVLDYDGDGNPDLLAAYKSGSLYSYPGLGDGTFGERVLLGGDFDLVDMLVSPGDVDRDGFGDFLVRVGPTQKYRLHLSRNEEQVDLGRWLGDPTQSRHYSQVVAAGDLDGNGSPDLVTVDSRTGALYRQSLSATGAVSGFTTLQASGWGAFRLPAFVSEHIHDYNMDSAMDVVAFRPSNGNSFFYPGGGSGGLNQRVSWGTVFSDLNKLENAGDLTGDGRPDLIGRVGSTGELYVYPGNGTGVDHAARVKIGTGWNGMDTILGGYDYDYDGKPDILAREKGGSTLWLYPGLGNGKVGARKAFDTVDMSDPEMITSLGDFNHDGFPDLLARNHGDRCLVVIFGQGGADYFKTGSHLDCAWDGWDAMTDFGDAYPDGHNDFIARIGDNMWLYRGDGKGGIEQREAFAYGWQGLRIA